MWMKYSHFLIAYFDRLLLQIVGRFHLRQPHPELLDSIGLLEGNLALVVALGTAFGSVFGSAFGAVLALSSVLGVA